MSVPAAPICRLKRPGPIKLRAGNELAPIWTFTNGDGQRNVIDTVPGQAGYSPLGEVRRVT